MRRSQAQVVFGCASVLLSYPAEDGLADDLEAVGTALARLPRGPAREAMDAARAWLSTMSPMEAAAAYVETFDLRRRRSLYLTYYRHGDTRERGQALVALAGVYRIAGMALLGGELPDFLPALLELAAVSTDGQNVLHEHRPALESLREELDEAGSPWAGVVGAVASALGGLARVDRVAIRRYRSEGPPSERVGLEPFAPPEVLGQGVTTR
ncbi:MAG: nitrate reductase molybdenum cofactor assembly chaperone [Acidimicrobiales bacterium]